MARWLFKEEPEHYSYEDLERDKRTIWDGVSNALARKYLRQIQVGDEVLYYHTGKEKAIVGEMRVVSVPRTEGNSSDPQAVVVEVEAVRRLRKAVPLARIKNDKALADWDLVRLPRLSVMPVTEEQWQRVQELSEADG